MPFTWKNKKDIYKGEGIYFLTFVVTGRQSLLGTLVPVTQANTINWRTNAERYGEHIAKVQLTPFGYAVSDDLQHIEDRHPGLQLCAKQLMHNHIHLVVWQHRKDAPSIRQIAHGIRLGITKLAQEFGAWPPSPVGAAPSSPLQSSAVRPPSPASAVRIPSPVSTAGRVTPGVTAPSPGLVLERAFIRTLSHAGQLRSMIDYTHANPDHAWLRRQHPDLYTIRRDLQLAGLHFDAMGKSRLLDYPDRQVIALRRSLTADQIAAEVQHALRLAESGTVTYTAAINEGEKAVSKAIRGGSWPLVVMLLDGFPPEGSEHARYYHPNGVYHTACGEGHLLLLSPHADNYNNPTLIALTDQELQRKAAEKGLHYTPIPHDTKRWRMIAGNVMLRMIAGVAGEADVARP